jgi:hypothetical protein
LRRGSRTFAEDQVRRQSPTRTAVLAANWRGCDVALAPSVYWLWRLLASAGCERRTGALVGKRLQIGRIGRDPAEDLAKQHGHHHRAREDGGGPARHRTSKAFGATARPRLIAIAQSRRERRFRSG